MDSNTLHYYSKLIPSSLVALLLTIVTFSLAQHLTLSVFNDISTTLVFVYGTFLALFFVAIMLTTTSLILTLIKRSNTTNSLFNMLEMALYPFAVAGVAIAIASLFVSSFDLLHADSVELFMTALPAHASIPLASAFIATVLYKLATKIESALNPDAGLINA
mgnify:FL=1